MKILSWNVNGLERCRRRGGFLQLLERQNPDIVCCQEIKNQCVLNTPGYYLFWNPAKRKNYSGTLILSKKEPLSCCTELGIEELDEEGRLIVLEYIDEDAFSNLTSLTGELVLPDGITEIGEGAFYGCSGFTGELSLPDSLCSIGEMAFKDCSGFTGALTIPGGVTTISQDAFANCSQLSGTLTLSEGVKYVEQNAFTGCSKIECIDIPSTMEKVESTSFNECPSVQRIVCHGSLDTISRRYLPYGIKIEYVD